MTLIERAEDMRKILQIGVAWRVGRAVIDVEQAREYERAIAALLDVVEAARLFLGDDSTDSDDLCAAVNRVMRGIDGHDWSEWGEPYECGAGMCHIRHCRTCNTYEARPVEDGDA